MTQRALPCGCEHAKDLHKRGWGPCTFAADVVVTDADGTTRGSGRVSCPCRRYVAAGHPRVSPGSVVLW